MSLNPGYPNIELLEYKTKQYLFKDPTVKLMIEKWKDEHKYVEPISLEADVFPQMWGSTCTGFDVTEDGSPAISGQAITKEYTTVFHELHTDVYLIYFGERACYLVKNPTVDFFTDLKNRSMASLSEAKNRY